MSDLSERLARLSPAKRKLLERQLAARRAGGAPEDLDPLPRDGRPYPLSYAQERFWFLEQLHPGNPAHHVPGLVRLTGPLDLSALAASITAALDRHEITRARFRVDDGRPVQVLGAPLRPDLTPTDLRGSASGDRDHVLERMVQDVVHLPFALDRGPLARVRILRLEDEVHEVVTCAHHIITDGLSTALFMREVLDGYRRRLAGGDGDVAAGPIQYVDYAAWQRRSLTDEVLAPRLEWWRTRLAGVASLPLPRDLATDDDDWRTRGARETSGPAPDTWPRLQTLAAREGVTPFMALLAAWQIVLFRMTGEADVAVGVPVAGRDRIELAPLIGLFVNSLVMRTDLSSRPTFRETLHRVKAVCLDAYDHGDVPFERVVDAVRPARRLDENPLFQVMFNLVDYAPLRVDLGALRSEYRPALTGTLVDLTLYAVVDADRLRLELEYDARRFRPATVLRLLEAYERLLGAALDAPDTVIGRLPLVAEREHQALLDAASTPPAATLASTLHGAVERATGRFPDAIAVRHGDDAWTFVELDARARDIAGRLGREGLGPGDAVAVLLPRSPDMIAAILGVLKAGAAWVPIDVTYPAARVALLLRESGAAAVLTTAPSADLASGTDARLLDLAGIGPAARSAAVEVTPESPAYILFTSGSTGIPKGVVVPHRAVVAYVSWAVTAYDVGAGGGSPLHTSIGFDLTITSLFPPLAAGTPVVILPEGNGIEPLARTVGERPGFSHVKLTPSHLDALLQRVAPERLAAWTRTLVLGGEALDYRQVAALRRHAPRTKLVNEYGPTEATVGCAMHEIAADEPTAGPVPIGRPIAGASLFVLDDERRPTPIGVRGELFVGGSGLAIGYHGRPHLTGERFVPHPFAETADARLYRTGDLARRRADGLLEFLGRHDDQVKVRGHRVEPGEVETLLLAQDGVQAAVVATRPTASGDGVQLVAWVVARDDVADRLRESLRRVLPEPLVPTVIVAVHELPVTPHGKVDRAALPAPRRDRLAGIADYAAPRDAAEERLARIWCDVLGLERVGVHDNFFDLGGDSILSLRIVSRARRAGLGLTTRQIFEHQSIAGLAAAAGRAPLTVVESGPVVGPVPLTPIQRWFFALDVPRRDHWNQALLLTLAARAAVHVDRALAALVAHHDSLRMRFSAVDGTWTARGTIADDVTVETIDARSCDDAARRSLVADVGSRTQASLDLARGPLIRIVRFATEDERPDLLLIVIHHLVVDGVSWRILLEDLETALSDLIAGREPALPPATTSFARWSARLEAEAGAAATRRDASFWEAAARRPAARLPIDQAQGVPREADAEEVVVALDEATTAGLFGPANRAWRTRPDELILAALGRALDEHTGGRPLRVDLEGHGRFDLDETIDTSRTTGWFTAIHPVLVGGHGEGLAAAIRGTKEAVRRVPRGGLGYGLLHHGQARATESPRPAEPRAEVLFNDLGRLDLALADGTWLGPVTGWDVGPLRDPTGAMSHRLEINVHEWAGVLNASFRFNRHLHRRATIEGIAGRFCDELAAVVAHTLLPAAGGFTPADFPLATLDQAALDSLVRETPGLERVYPLSWTQQGMFFHRLLAPESPAYFEQLTTEFAGPVDRGAIRGALEDLMRRHELFRARVAWHGLEEPVLVVAERVPLPLTELDWRDAAAEFEPRLARFLDEDRTRGFAPDRAPLFRSTLIRVAPEHHVLVFSYHHLVLDGWSMPVLLREVLALYRAHATGVDARLPQVSPYGDFIRWLRAQDLDGARRFWEARLADVGERTPLASAPTSVETERYGEVELAIPAAQTDRIAASARRIGVTLSTLLRGAWALWLARTGRRDDVVFGATVAGRPAALADVESRIGLFINTLPIRVRVPEDRAVVDWLVALQREQTELEPFEHTPLLVSQTASGVPADQPLFDSILVFENYPTGADAGPAGGLVVRSVRTFERTSYPVTLVCIPGEELLLRVIHDERTLDEAAARELLERLATILDTLSREPDTRLGSLDFLTEPDRARLDAWSRSDADDADDAAMPVLARLRATARAHPDRLAIAQAERSWTYAELLARADHVAGRVRACALPPGSIVGVLAARSPEWVAGVLGVLAAEAAWLTLDPDHPDPRLAHQLDDADVRLLLVDAERAERARAFGREIILVADDPDVVAAGVPTSDDPERPAYVIYTSGSTGRPKGVVVPHRALAHFTATAVHAYGITAHDRVLQFAATTFDTCIEELFPALVAGAAVVLRTTEHVAGPAAFCAAVARERITVVDLPTAFWHELVGGLRAEHVADLASVRLVILGGEAVRGAALMRWRDLVGERVRLLNTYGPTEATVVATVADLTAPAHTPAPARIPIGRPLPGVEVRVLETPSRAALPGTPGELFLGGPGLARGYVGLAGDTAARFGPHPYAPARRLYRTGDLVRLRGDGTLEFLGRVDRQQKIRGWRVEPEEIEAVLAAHPAVTGCAVEADDGALIAWLATSADQPDDEAAWRSWLADRLPEAMVPSRVIELRELPLTDTGKVDRRALPRPAGERRDLAAAFAPPRTPEEEALVATFAALFGVDRVGIHDGFFALGGNSLVAVRLMARLEERFDVRLPLRDLFEGPTPAELAATVARLVRGEPLDALRARRALDLVAEARLDDAIRPQTGPRPTSPPERILLTGATGYLGAFLLRDLLARTPARVTCLVRADDAAHGRRRLAETLARLELSPDVDLDRVDVVAGDLARPRLGLSQPAFDELAATADSVHHAGAATDFFRPWAALAPTNVGGTREILRLACRGRSKTLHHVSTVGVFETSGPPPLDVVDEATALLEFRDVVGGYARTKWVAEEMARSAGARGLAVNVYRVGRLVGDTRRGVWNENDFVCLLFAACAAVGAVPDVDVEADATPVDFASEAIVALALDSDSRGRAFHVINPHSVHTGVMRDWLAQRGHHLERIGVAEWRTRLQRAVGDSPGHPAYPLLPFFGPESAAAAPTPPAAARVDGKATALRLARLGTSCPRIADEILDRYLRFLIARGLIGEPGR